MLQLLTENEEIVFSVIETTTTGLLAAARNLAMLVDNHKNEQLCVVTDVLKHGDAAVVITLLGDDRPDDNLDNDDHCSCYSCIADAAIRVGNRLIPAKNVEKGMKIWLDVEAHKAAGHYHS
jgi:hypothetical protein